MKKFPRLLALLFLLLAGCGGRLTTATEPGFRAVASAPATAEDAALAATLAAQDPAPSDPVALAVSILGVDPASLPVAPSAPLAAYQVGDQRTFWVHNGDTFETLNITAELMVIGAHAYFWQDAAAQPLNAQGAPAAAADWADAAASFDESYEQVRAAFGSEETPGLDGDPRLFVIYSDNLGRVGGYFGQADLLPSAVVSASNQGQFFYISNTWSSGVASAYNKEVLAHEFQHMVQKNVDPNEEGWLNEGFSMLAQQVAGMRGDNSLAEYLAKPDQSLWFWSGEPQDYGQSYLYVDYLYEQMGAEFIRSLSDNPANGLVAIDQELTAAGSARNADEMYADAMLAAYINDPAASAGQYAFTNPTLIPLNPRYAFESLPGLYQGSVQQYGGVDFITAEASGNVTVTFTGDGRVPLIPAEPKSGTQFWWSNRYDSTFSTLTREVDLTAVTSATLHFWAWYDIEEDWDYAYVLASRDGGAHWDLLPSSSSRSSDPNAQNLGQGISGVSGGGEAPVWVQETVDLSTYAGAPILLRFAVQNDLVVNHAGLALDDLSIPEIGWADDAEAGASGWEASGFVLSHNYVPQVWGVQAAVMGADGSLTVHPVDVAGGAGSLELKLDESAQIVLMVLGQTRATDTPAFYQLELRR